MQEPAFNPDQLAQLQRTEALIRRQMAEAGGRLPFDRFMELALYAPGAGYYVNGTRKFGAAGDFVTAPELSPLFSQCLANQCAQVLAELGDGELLEFGAGSGIMAADMLARLQQLDRLPSRYLILELSPDLRARQRERIASRVPALLDRVSWIDRLPGPGWQGVVVANEVVDAMPVQQFRLAAGHIEELFVTSGTNGFAPAWDLPQTPGLEQAVRGLEQRLGAFASGFRSEINLRLPAWLAALAAVLGRGALLLIDYGYSEREYYHPQRSAGTLVCHLQHRAYADPLRWVGLQDITANVDFSALAGAGLDAGLTLAGYTTQAHFLINNGLQGLLESGPEADRLARLQQLKQLTLPTAMGERFKVIGLTTGLQIALDGFTAGDLAAYL